MAWPEEMSEINWVMVFKVVLDNQAEESAVVGVVVVVVVGAKGNVGLRKRHMTVSNAVLELSEGEVDFNVTSHNKCHPLQDSVDSPRVVELSKEHGA